MSKQDWQNGFITGLSTSGSVGGNVIDCNMYFHPTDPPEDTNKIWVKAEQQHRNVEIDNVISSIAQSNVVSTGKVIDSLNMNSNSMMAEFGSNTIYALALNIHKEYNIDTNTLTDLLPSDTGNGDCAICNVKGTIYLFRPDITNDKLEISTYDPITNTKNIIITESSTISQYITLSVVNNDIYIVGYHPKSMNDSGKIYKFSIDDGSLTYTNVQLGDSLRYNVGSACVGTNIYFFGGESSVSNVTNTIFKYDTVTNTLTTLDITLSNPSTYTAAAIGTDIYIFDDGTSIQKLNTINETIETLDGINLTSNTLGNSKSCVAVGNKIYVNCENGLEIFTAIPEINANSAKILTYNCKPFSKRPPIKLIDSEVLKLNVSGFKYYLGDADNYGSLKETYVYDKDTSSWVLTY